MWTSCIQLHRWTAGLPLHGTASCILHLDMFIWTSYLSSIINNWEWTARFLEGIFKFCESIVRIGIGCYPPLFFLRDMTDFCRISKTCIGSLAKSERCDHSFTPPPKKKLYWLIVWRQCIRLAQHTNYQRNQVFLKRLDIYIYYRLYSWYTIFSSSVILPLTLPTGSRSKSEQMMRRNLKENNSFDFAHNCTHLRAKFGELELELVWRSC